MGVAPAKRIHIMPPRHKQAQWGADTTVFIAGEQVIGGLKISEGIHHAFSARAVMGTVHVTLRILTPTCDIRGHEHVTYMGIYSQRGAIVCWKEITILGRAWIWLAPVNPVASLSEWWGGRETRLWGQGNLYFVEHLHILRSPVFQDH